MPELPEVETIRRGLNECLRGKTIVGIVVRCPDVLQGASAGQFRKRLHGARFQRLDRLGKFLLLHMDNGTTLIVDLRMSGQLVYEPLKAQTPPHTHVTFSLSDGAGLRFTDPRRFGSLKVVATVDRMKHPSLRRLGLDALSARLTCTRLAAALQGSRRPVKLFLLDQQKIAGIGNIYASEILFEARIHPETSADALSFDHVRRLHRAIRKILTRAIRSCGTTMRDFRTGTGGYGNYQNEFRVYAREGLPCSRCCHPVTRIRTGGRSTYLCCRCQLADP